MRLLLDVLATAHPLSITQDAALGSVALSPTAPTPKWLARLSPQLMIAHRSAGRECLAPYCWLLEGRALVQAPRARSFPRRAPTHGRNARDARNDHCASPSELSGCHWAVSPLRGVRRVSCAATNGRAHGGVHAWLPRKLVRTERVGVISRRALAPRSDAHWHHPAKLTHALRGSGHPHRDRCEIVTTTSRDRALGVLTRGFRRERESALSSPATRDSAARIQCGQNR